MATENFVPVAGDDWYQRRRNDREGEFLRYVTDQAGRGSRDANGGTTRQGIYCLTASGRLLCWKNAGQLPDEMRRTLRQGLELWSRLPAEERRPGSVHVEEIQLDPRFARTPPPGGVIMNVYTRALERAPDGLRIAMLKLDGACPEPQRDHLWLTESEWRALVSSNPKPGDRIPVSMAVLYRILRFHLVDSTLGEPVAWSREEVRSGSITLTVTEATPATVVMRLEGAALVSSDADLARANRGYTGRLSGNLIYNVSSKTLDRFDFIALGDYWERISGKNEVNRKVLGTAFAITRGNSPADRVPPQGARWLEGYLRADTS